MAWLQLLVMGKPSRHCRVSPAFLEKHGVVIAEDTSRWMVAPAKDGVIVLMPKVPGGAGRDHLLAVSVGALDHALRQCWNRHWSASGPAVRDVLLSIMMAPAADRPTMRTVLATGDTMHTDFVEELHGPVDSVLPSNVLAVVSAMDPEQIRARQERFVSDSKNAP